MNEPTRTFSGRVPFLFAFGALLFVGCKESAPAPAAQVTSAAPLTPPPTIAPSASAAPGGSASISQLVGKWEGSFDVKPHKVELAEKAANEKAWAKDDGTQKAGKGTLSLVIAADGSATGTASGALGDVEVGGAAEKDLVTLRLVAKDTADPLAMTGVLVLRPTGSDLGGELHASSGDSYVVREASVTLKKTP